jgi:hypothetical protein
MRLSPGIIGHLSGGRARGEGLNRCRLRAGGEQSAGRRGRKCGADPLPHLWSSLVGSCPDRSRSEQTPSEGTGDRFTFAPNIAVGPTMIAPGARDINAIAARDDHIHLPATALGTDKPVAPIENRRVRAISSSDLGSVRLDPVATRLAPHDQPHLRVRRRVRRIAERHRRAGW